MLYFIQAGDKNGPIKIGVSSNPTARLRSLQVANHQKLKILLLIPGNKLREKITHGMFSESCIHGEWFNPTEDLKNFISQKLLVGWSSK